MNNHLSLDYLDEERKKLWQRIESLETIHNAQPQASSEKMLTKSIFQAATEKFKTTHFSLSWSHYFELTLPEGANIHAREYQLYLPSKELLKAKLNEWMSMEEKLLTTDHRPLVTGH